MSPYRQTPLSVKWRERAESLRRFHQRLASLVPPVSSEDLQTVREMAQAYDQCAEDFEKARERGEV